ncbi:hypothetical protein SRRS_42250 [Sporomusa rhizae]|uniref:hypothetical protein n=1 Tax=Sporomusa rhizae TaxID=357999 RepID=UPI00352BA61D
MRLVDGVKREGRGKAVHSERLFDKGDKQNVTLGFGERKNYLTGRAKIIIAAEEQQKNNDNYYKTTTKASASKATESSHMCVPPIP